MSGVAPHGNLGKKPVLNSINVHEISKKCYSKLENIVSTFWKAKNRKNEGF